MNLAAVPPALVVTLRGAAAHEVLAVEDPIVVSLVILAMEGLFCALTLLPVAGVLRFLFRRRVPVQVVSIKVVFSPAGLRAPCLHADVLALFRLGLRIIG